MAGNRSIILCGFIAAFSLFASLVEGQTLKLTARDGRRSDDFGRAVAINSRFVLIGTPRDGDRGNDAGSVYVFDSVTGALVGKLLARDGTEGDRFGASCAISDRTAVIGAYLDDIYGECSGSAYLVDLTNGRQIAKLVPSTGAAADLFGYSVAVHGTTVLVGAPGADLPGRQDCGAVFAFDAVTGTELGKLVAGDGDGDRFGESVAITRATAIVGAPYADDKGQDAGAAYLFDTRTGSQIAKLLASDGFAGDAFGCSVAIDGTTAIIGAHLDDVYGEGSGSAYLFDTTGAELAKLVPDGGKAGLLFGVAVAMSGRTAVIGSSGGAQGRTICSTRPPVNS